MVASWDVLERRTNAAGISPFQLTESGQPYDLQIFRWFGP